MLLVALSIFILILAPLIHKTTANYKKGLWSSFDRILAIIVGCLVVAHLLPHAVEESNLFALVFAVVGILVPSMMERFFVHASSQIHLASLLVGILGLSIHGMSDGAAFSQVQNPDFKIIASAVLLHRLPEGLLICTMFRKHKGLLHPWSLIAFLSIMTLVGYFLANYFIETHHDLYLHDSHVHIRTNVFVGYLKALICGTLLHAVIDNHQRDDHQHDCPDHYH